MSGHYIHDIDPIIASIGGVHLWWYGLSYSLGFLNAHLFLRRNRDRLGLSIADVYELSVLLAFGVLARNRDARRYLLPVEFGPAAQFFFVALFVLTGAYLPWDDLVLVSGAAPA